MMYYDPYVDRFISGWEGTTSWTGLQYTTSTTPSYGWGLKFVNGSVLKFVDGYEFNREIILEQKTIAPDAALDFDEKDFVSMLIGDSE